MLDDAPSSEDVQRWFIDVAVLASGERPISDVKVKVAAYARFLRTRYPRRCFTEETAEALADRCNFFPRYAEVTGFLKGIRDPIRERRDRLAIIAALPDKQNPPPPDTGYEAMGDEQRAAFDATLAAIRSKGSVLRGV